MTADRWSRKPTIVGASALTSLLGLVYPSVKDPVLLPIVGFALTIPMTEVRLRASGICNTFGRGAFIATLFLVVSLFQAYGVSGVLDFMIELLILQILVALWLGIELRHQPLDALKHNAQAPDPSFRIVFAPSTDGTRDQAKSRVGSVHRRIDA